MRMNVQRRSVCVCVCVRVRCSGIIDPLKVQCVCVRWIRGAGAGLWACKILPQLWLLAVPVCLTRTDTNTHRVHKLAQTCTQIYIWVLLSLYRLSVERFYLCLFLWIGESAGISAALFGRCKPDCWEKKGRFYVILSEAHESSIDFLLFRLNFKVRVSAAHL